MLDFNTEPYNDDFDENNKFYRILFRPSFAVQARELTQMQTILQNQIKRNGDHIFKQGAMVIPGQISIDTKYSYVKLQEFYSGSVTETYVENLLGQIVTGETTGVQAKVVHIEHAEGSEETTLYVRYLDSGTDSQTKTFADNEVISDGVNTPVQAILSDATGVGCAATVQRGVYYVNGFFVLCDEQTIILDKYTNSPSYRVGLMVDEQKIAPETTYTSLSTGETISYDMLLDNAQNSYNYAAPGAHRYYIDLVLTKIPLYSSALSWLNSSPFEAGRLIKNGSLYYLVTTAGTSGTSAPTHTSGIQPNGTVELKYIGLYNADTDSTSDENFIELLSTLQGTTQRIVNTTSYSEIEKTLARRTFDESGNYTVKAFKIDVREHRNNDRGEWQQNTAYRLGDVVSYGSNKYIAKNNETSSSTPPTHTSGVDTDGAVNWEYTTSPYYNRGVYTPEQGGEEAKLAIGLEPGKAYVDGYEIEKIVTEYVTIDKARDYNQVTDAYVNAAVGNYVLVTNLNSLAPFDTTSGYATINIYDRFTTSVGSAPAGANLIGTARVRSLTYDSGTQGSQSAVYKMHIFDLRMTAGYDFSLDAKSFYYSKSGPDFTADISPVTTLLIGSATTYTTYPTKGSSDTLTGFGSAWQGGDASRNSPALSVGDYVYVGDPALGGVRRRVTTVTNNASIVLDSSVTADGSLIYLVKTNTVETSSDSQYYTLPNYAIRSTRSSTNSNEIIYYVTRYVLGSTGAATGTPGNPGAYCTLTLTVGDGGGVFASGDDIDNYIIVSETDGKILKPLAAGSGGGTSITFTIDCSTTDYSSSSAFVAMATIRKTGADGGEKAKNLEEGSITITSQAAATGSFVSLGVADILRVKSVLMDTGTFAAPTGSYTIDIMDRFDLDNGQRDTHYDLGKLILKTSYSPPSAPITITFEYFSHSSGDYFSVNSYDPNEIRMEDIPSYNTISLRDVLDFRPRIGNAGTSFSGTGSSFSNPIKRGSDITLDYSYYMSRKDKIAIDFSGQFFNIRGVASDNPGFPSDPALGMVLYGLSLQPYTFGTTTASVIVDTYENKRYTMRDIGKLENRIANLEYYTTLSLIEQDTKSLSIKDSNGLDRFKNGFIVDAFTGHNVGNVLSPDYLCSIDMENQELRPFFTMDNVNMVETLTSDASRSSAGYKMYGDVITLPVVDQPVLVKQPYGSRLENINPFAVFTFLGDVSMNPSSDDWFETQSAPDIVRNVEGNFNTIAALAINDGLLGTIWNAWQVTWAPPAAWPAGGYQIQYTTGSNWANQRALSQGATYVDVNTFNQRFGSAGGSGPARQVYVQQTAQTGTAFRTGLKTTLAAQYEQQVVDDKIISTALIPYMRSRNILVQTKKLKPNTQFYPYFDNIAVGAYCTPASMMTYTLSSTNDFDIKSNAGGDANTAPRIISYTSGQLNGDTTGNMCLNKGDVITGGTSGATAVVIGIELNPDTDVRTLHLANVKGTFIGSETITGSISGSIGVVGTTHEDNKSFGDSLVTNFKGDLNFIFWLPNDDSVKFRTGTREFKLLDVSTVDGQQSSSAKIQYEATGVLQTRQRTINSIRNAHLVQEIVSENDTVSRTAERVTRDTGWYDPLAQTFLVQQKGGAFLSKIDVFFATKDTKLPVTMEIREVVNGYPGQRILPFSKVTLDPTQVNISTTTVQLTDGSGASYPKYDTPTTFTFPSPVYVQENQEYAIVLASDSNNYKCWISQMGDQIPGSSRTISEQPYLGSLFKSQNATTWTAAQDQDLMFTVYRCKFDTQVVGSVQFTNDILQPDLIDNDPFEIVGGTNKVRVWHRNHGLFPNSRVQFDNLDTTVYTGIQGAGTITTSTSSTTVNGVGTQFISEMDAGTVLFRKSDGKYLGVVDYASSDTVLVLRSNCTTTISSAAQFNYANSINGIPVTELYYNANPQSPLTITVSSVDPDSYTINTTSNATSTGYAGGGSVTAVSNINYDVLVPLAQVQNFSDTTCTWQVKTTTGKSFDGTESPYTVDSNWLAVTANDNNYFSTPRVVASPINQSTFTSGNKTLSLQATLHTDNDALSPMIDTHRISAVVVSNKINYPTESNTNVDPVDIRQVFTGATGAFSFTGKTITTSDSGIAALIQTISVGRYITISGATTTGNNGTYLVTGIAGDGSTTGTITVDRTSNFASESAVSGTTVQLRLLFVNDIAPFGSSTINKYVSKIVTLDKPASFLNIRYAVNCPTEADIFVYYKTSPVGTTVDFNSVNWTLASPDTLMPKVKNGSPGFIDMTYSIKDIPLYDKVTVKLVMASTNTSAIPRIKDLRIIACA